MAPIRLANSSHTLGLTALSLLTALLFCFPAYPADSCALVQQSVDAGEFGPALAIANAVRDQEQRDQLLAQIAAAQAGAGARDGSLHTAYSISSDTARKSAFDSVSTRRRPPRGAMGGGAIADFDSLIELITSTVKPDSWDDVGGPGAVDSFRGGVIVDSAGLLRKLPPGVDRSLIDVHRAGVDVTSTANPHRASTLRKVSLTRLERHAQLLAAQGLPPTEVMQTLAGLQHIKYILVYPQSGDIVLAGPAGDWRRDTEGRLVDAEKGAPVLHLDDLVVTLRNAYAAGGRFGCSINPRKDNLAAAQAVNEKWSQQPLKPGQREKWLAEFRGAVGRQDIVVYGIDPRTRVGRVLIEADYRMKLVGIGLEEPTPGVQSYLSTIVLGKDGKPPPMNVLRWWFTLNYDALSASENRDAFELHGPGVKVLSENELLTQQGDRIHTGASDDLTQRFAESFTNHFDELAAKYPIYAELRNVFDLSLVAAVMQSHDLPGQVGWHMTHFGPSGDYEPELGTAPAEVETVMNHRLIGGRHVVAVVSGGVRVESRPLAARDAVKTDRDGPAATDRQTSQPQQLPARAWWWD